MVRKSVTKSRAFARTVALGVAVAGWVAMVNPGAAGAAVDNARSMPLDGGATIEVLQADTAFQSVPPLDSSPLSVEFFNDGVAAVRITGPGADAFKGTKLTIGYQIGYPVALPGAVITLNTPSLDWGVGSNFNLGVGDLFGSPSIGLDVGTNSALGGSIIPSNSIEFDLEPGGITEVPLVQDAAFDGSGVLVRIAGAHGAVSGVLGPVTVRPFAKATTSRGDTVITYGVPQRV